MDSLWIERKNRLPCEADGDANGHVLAWHIYQGAILCTWSRFDENRFYTHWMRADNLKNWMATDERKPSHEDGDFAGCVLLKMMDEQLLVIGWHQLTERHAGSAWTHLPSNPE